MNEPRRDAAGVFLCPQRAAGILRRNRTRLLPRRRKNFHGEKALRIFNGRFRIFEKVRPARRLSPFPSRAAKLRRGNRSSQKRSAPTAKTDKDPTLRSPPAANADTPPAGTSAPAGLLRKHAGAGALHVCEYSRSSAEHHAGKRHPQGTSASFPVQKQASAASKNFHDAILKQSIKVLSYYYNTHVKNCIFTLIKLIHERIITCKKLNILIIIILFSS